MLTQDVFIARLTALINEYTGAATPIEVRPGYVAVRPKGPRGVGKVRFWPEVIHQDAADPGKYYDLNYLSYLSRMTRTPNPFADDGRMFCTPGQWGDAFQPSEANKNRSFPDHTDAHMNPFDWFTQDDLDQQAALAARDAEGHGFSGGR